MKIQGYPNPGDGLRLHLNENTGGCSPAVLDAIRRIRPADVSVYPSYRDAVLGCARHFDVDPDWILMTNGLDEGILMAAVGHIAHAGLHDAETIIPLPAFDPYPNSTAAVGATPVRVPPGRDYAFPTDAVLAAITPRTRLIFLNTPNNPTGQLIAIDDLVRISEAAPHAIVLIDEAYIEFGGTTFLPRLSRHANVLVGRTFSKAYGLAGHTHRHRDRPTAGAGRRARRHAAVQSQRGGPGSHGRRACGRRFSPAVRRAGARVAGTPVCRVRPPRP